MKGIDLHVSFVLKATKNKIFCKIFLLYLLLYYYNIHYLILFKYLVLFNFIHIH